MWVKSTPIKRDGFMCDVAVDTRERFYMYDPLFMFCCGERLLNTQSTSGFSAQKATATRLSRAEVKLVTCTQLFEAGS